ncbi:MAG: hypothetical protein GF388_12220, partial [Candidatus Aegiribacteria sp.]|nr:hypothetical protein [Candidatus Aegiribacteria sp.]MBD3295718.1 hypothetical protein [Candidatus Fermentibacteria bacterium]
MDESPDFHSLGLVGWPLKRTLSPFIHERFLESAGLKGLYKAYPIEPANFLSDLNKLLESGVTGLNVTYPYKARAAESCSRLVDEAQRLKVVNTLVPHLGNLLGYNTDVIGFRIFAQENRMPEPFYITGCGGAAAAAAQALSAMGAECSVLCRHPGEWKGNCRCYHIQELPGLLKAAGRGTLVNATTLGWNNEDVFPVEPAQVSGLVFADLNYNADWSWRKRVARYAKEVYTGETMLV